MVDPETAGKRIGYRVARSEHIRKAIGAARSTINTGCIIALEDEIARLRMRGERLPISRDEWLDICTRSAVDTLIKSLSKELLPRVLVP